MLLGAFFSVYATLDQWCRCTGLPAMCKAPTVSSSWPSDIEMRWDRQHCKADTGLLLIYCSKKQAICKHLYSYLWRAINGLRQASHLILKSWWAACCAHNSSSNPSLLRAGLVLYLSLSSSHLTRCLRQSRNPVNSHDVDILSKLKSCVLIDHF